MNRKRISNSITHTINIITLIMAAVYVIFMVFVVDMKKQVIIDNDRIINDRNDKLNRDHLENIHREHRTYKEVCAIRKIELIRLQKIVARRKVQ